LTLIGPARARHGIPSPPGIALAVLFLGPGPVGEYTRWDATPIISPLPRTPRPPGLTIALTVGLTIGLTAIRPVTLIQDQYRDRDELRGPSYPWGATLPLIPGVMRHYVLATTLRRMPQDAFCNRRQGDYLCHPLKCCERANFAIQGISGTIPLWHPFDTPSRTPFDPLSYPF
jgi:hypothetical protein